MLRKINSRWVTKGAALFFMSCTLGNHRSFSQVVTPKHMNQIGEGLRTCVGTITVQKWLASWEYLEFRPFPELLWDFLCGQGTTSCLVEWNVIGIQGGWSPRPESTGLGPREESWPLKFSASRWCGERRIRRRDSYELSLMGSLEKAVLICFMVWISQGRWHLRFVTWQAYTCQMH